MTDVVDQPPPVVRAELVPVWELVIGETTVRFAEVTQPDHRRVVDDVLADMRARDALGRQRYGTPLTTDNGRDQVVDLYQELLDAAVYARAAIAEGKPIPPEMYRRIVDDVVFIRRVISGRGFAAVPSNP